MPSVALSITVRSVVVCTITSAIHSLVAVQHRQRLWMCRTPIHAFHHPAARIRYVVCTIRVPCAHALPITLVDRQIVGPNASLIRIVPAIRHVSVTNVRIHASALVARTHSATWSVIVRDASAVRASPVILSPAAIRL